MIPPSWQTYYSCSIL
uniref:Uncharacterized protein n=1 Tax=Arundo donax TaxID=35708 RepID=A0A0A9C8W1_ARUDO